MTPPVDRPLFIAQDKLTLWEGEGKVTVVGMVLHLVAQERSYQLQEAVRFLTLAGATVDPNKLLGRVRTRDQLRAMKAEHYPGSVIVGDTAYDVQEGFVGTVQGAPARTISAVVPQAAPPPPAAVPVVAKPAATSVTVGPTTDAQLLADFLLTNLTG